MRVRVWAGAGAWLLWRDCAARGEVVASQLLLAGTSKETAGGGRGHQLGPRSACIGGMGGAGRVEGGNRLRWARRETAGRGRRDIRMAKRAKPGGGNAQWRSWSFGQEVMPMLRRVRIYLAAFPLQGWSMRYALLEFHVPQQTKLHIRI